MEHIFSIKDYVPCDGEEFRNGLKSYDTIYDGHSVWPGKHEDNWVLETATMTFIRSYNIYEDKGNTEGDKAMSHPWKSRGTIVGRYEPQEEVPHGHAERDKVCY
ncbi:MAG: hypothetical protein QW292_11180 [Candidatus Parvarchaeota archaeon]